MRLLACAAVVLGLVCSSAVPLAAQSAGFISVADAGRYVGATREVCGAVTRIVGSGSSIVIEMGADSTALAVVLPSRPGGLGAGRLPLTQQRYVSQPICVNGRITRSQNRLQLAAPDEAQIVIEPAPSAREALRGSAYRIGDAGLTPPRLVHEEKPAYTPEALKAGIAGSVEIEAIVMPNGSVGHLRIVQSLDSAHGLDAQATAAVAKWRFAPGALNGTPVPVIIRVTTSFLF